MVYHVDIVNKGGQVFQVSLKEYEFIIDMKGAVGVTPPDALLASLGACIGVYLRKYAQGIKIDIPEFSISVDADFSKEAPVCFKKITVNVDSKGTKLDENKLNAMIRFMKNCPVHNTLKSNPQVDIRIV